MKCKEYCSFYTQYISYESHRLYGLFVSYLSYLSLQNYCVYFHQKSLLKITPGPNQKKKKKPEKEVLHCYIFSGTWGWGGEFVTQVVWEQMIDCLEGHHPLFSYWVPQFFPINLLWLTALWGWHFGVGTILCYSKQWIWRANRRGAASRGKKHTCH